MNSPIDEAQTKTLLILPNNPGDVLMALQVAAQIKLQNPNTELHFLVDEECADLCLNSSYVDFTHSLPRKSYRNWISNPSAHSHRDNIWQAMQDFWNQLHSIDFDKVLNFFQNPSVAPLSQTLRYNEWRGLKLNQDGQAIVEDSAGRYLFSIPANRAQNPYHAIEVYMLMAGVSHPEPVEFYPEVSFKTQELIGEYSFYAVQFSSAWEGKKWPFKNFRNLLEKVNHPILLIGSPQDQQEAQALAEGLAHVKSIAGQTSLWQTLEVLSRADLLITGDTFAMHAAAAVSCPTICLFGPSNPYETGPYGNGHLILHPGQVLKENLEFQDSTLISSIPVEDVLNVLEGLAPNHSCLLASRINRATHKIEYAELIASGRATPNLELEVQFFYNVLKPHIEQQAHYIQEILLSPKASDLSTLEQIEFEFYQDHKNQIASECWSLALNALEWNENLIDYLNHRFELCQDWMNNPNQEIWLRDQTTVHQWISPGAISKYAPCCSTST